MAYTDFNDIVNIVNGLENDEIYCFCEALSSKKSNDMFDITPINGGNHKITSDTFLGGDEIIVTPNTEPIIFNILKEKVFGGLDYDSWFSLQQAMEKD